MKQFFKKNSDENSERGHFLKLMLNILKSFENHSMIYYFWYLFVQRKNTLHLGTLKQVLKYELIQKKVHKVIKFNTVLLRIVPRYKNGT